MIINNYMYMYMYVRKKLIIFTIRTKSGFMRRYRDSPNVILLHVHVPVSRYPITYE